MDSQQLFVDIASGLLDNCFEKNGSGVFFISFKDKLRNQMLAYLENEIGDCTYLDGSGRNLCKETGVSFWKFLVNKPVNANFIVFTRSVPFTKEAADNFLVKTKNAGVYEILPASDKACPPQAYTLLIQIKNKSALSD